MLKIEDVKTFLDNIIKTMRTNPPNFPEICADLRDIASLFQAIDLLKNSGVFTMISNGVGVFQMNLQKFPTNLPADSLDIIREEILNVSNSLEVISGSLDTIESYPTEVFKAAAQIHKSMAVLLRFIETIMTRLPVPNLGFPPSE